MKVKNKKILVYGLKSSGQACVNLLIKNKANVFVFDDDEESLKNFQTQNVMKLNSLCEEFIKTLDYMIISPSISVYNEWVKLAQLNNVIVMGELELGFNFLKGNVLAITGSNGKSTSVSLLANIFKCANKFFDLAGNIGKPLCQSVFEDKFKKDYILEVSSFQLETIKNFKSKICAILNVTPNHLDRHFNFENYVNAKKRIFENSNKNDIVVLNYDDENLKYLGDYQKFNTFFFSEKTEVKGAYFDNENLIVNIKNKEIILNEKQIKLLGKHNKMNVLCAVLMAKLYKIKNKFIVEGVSTFLGLEHRLEFVKEIDGVKYVNDSKATTIEACKKSVESFEESVVLLMGGSSKNVAPNLLFEKLPINLKHIVVFGQTADEILSVAKNFEFKNITKAENLEQALLIAKENALQNCVVLLAPAYASFDQFKNFEERGECFKNLVQKLEK